MQFFNRPIGKAFRAIGSEFVMGLFWLLLVTKTNFLHVEVYLHVDWKL